MLVRETLDACECDVCGISCTGRFANCWRSIFQANGRTVQMRCLPPSLPQLAEAASGADIVEETDPLIADSPAPGIEGGQRAVAGADGTPADFRYLDSQSELDLAALQHRVAEIVDLIHNLRLENGAIRSELASIAARLEVTEPPLSAPNASLRPVTHVVRPASESTENFTRPGRAVAHPDVVHRQHHTESQQSAEDELLTHPLAEGSSGGIG